MRLSKKQKISLAAAVVGGMALTGFLYLRTSPKQTVTSPVPVTIINEAIAAEADPKPVYVNYISLNDSEHPQRHRQQLRTLQRTGSLTGAMSVQFKQATHAKMSYRFGRKKPTVFVPAPLNELVPLGFVLTGREYDDPMADGVYRTIYHLFERPDTKQRIEVFETGIDVAEPLLRIKELQNQQVLGVPIQLERFVGKKSVVYYSAEIIIKDRLYQINTKDIEQAELMAFIERLIIAEQ